MRTRFLQLPDGNIQFLSRGNPPTEVPGYEVDPGDPYLFHPILPPCAARVFKDLSSQDCCPMARNIRHCTKYGYYAMTAETCKMCFDRGDSVPLPMVD